MPTQMPLFPREEKPTRPTCYSVTYNFYIWKEFKNYILALGATPRHIQEIKAWIDFEDDPDRGAFRELFIKNFEDEPELQSLLRDAGFPDSFSVHIY